MRLIVFIAAVLGFWNLSCGSPAPQIAGDFRTYPRYQEVLKKLNVSHIPKRGYGFYNPIDHEPATASSPPAPQNSTSSPNRQATTSYASTTISAKAVTTAVGYQTVHSIAATTPIIAATSGQGARSQQPCDDSVSTSRLVLLTASAVVIAVSAAVVVATILWGVRKYRRLRHAYYPHLHANFGVLEEIELQRRGQRDNDTGSDFSRFTAEDHQDVYMGANQNGAVSDFSRFTADHENVYSDVNLNETRGIAGNHNSNMDSTAPLETVSNTAPLGEPKVSVAKPHCDRVGPFEDKKTHSILSHENDSARQLSTSAAVGGGENPSPERPIEVNAEQLPGGSRDSAPLGGPPPNGDNNADLWRFLEEIGEAVIWMRFLRANGFDFDEVKRRQ